MRKTTIKSELILPAGDLEKAKYALEYGADAIYLGMPDFSMRKAEIRFTPLEIKEAIEYAHRLGKKAYVTFNIFAHNEMLSRAKKQLKTVSRFEPDAFIISDPGILSIAKEVAPNIPIHLSTQANTTNWQSALYWYNQGVKRIVLARELTLDEIKIIHKKVPKLELEIFVQGAMCIAYSGRCLLSAYMTGREANLGDCAQPCRWHYNVYLEEKLRPQEYFAIEESEAGTTIMSSRDLRLIGHLDEILESGVIGLKVEGRNKSIYYLATVARAYRGALDAIKANKYNKKLKLSLEKELETVNYREYTEGFLYGMAKNGETYDKRSPVRKYDFVAAVKGTKDKLTHIEVRNQIRIGDEVEIISPTMISCGIVKEIFDEDFHKAEVINPGKQNQVAYLKLSKACAKPFSLIRKKLNPYALPEDSKQIK